MAGPEALSVQSESPAITADPAAAVAGSSAASQRRPQLIPIAQLVAIVAGVLGIIWSQQQGIDNLRDEFTAAQSELRAEIGGLRAEMSDEIGYLRAEVSENGQRLARIEGHLGIGVPDYPTAMNPT